MSDNQAEDSLEQGIRFQKSGDHSNALKCLSMAVQANPKSARAWFWLGEAIEDSEKKAYCVERAYKLDPLIEIKESSVQTLEPIKANNNVFTVDLETAGSVLNPPPLTNQENTATPFINEIGIAPTSMGEPEIYKTPGQPLIENDSGLDLKPNHNQSNKSTKIAEKPLRKKEKISKQSKVIFFLIGLLISLLVFGLFILDFINSGKLDNYLSSIVGQNQLFTLPEPSSNLDVLPTSIENSNLQPPTDTNPLDFAARQKEVAGEIQSAQQKINTEAYAEAIEILNKVIEKMPDNAKAYYLRGMAYHNMVDSLHSKGEYIEYLLKALENDNRAIALNPYIGDYYLHRAYDFWDLANELDYQKEREPLFKSALENILLVKTLGTAKDKAQLQIGELYTLNGRCEEGTALLLQTLEQHPDATFDYEIHWNLARSYLCMGNYDEALDHINQAINDKDCDCDYAYDKGVILYSLGQLDEALRIINMSIESQPGYQGYRYYLRALIYSDQGKLDLAMADINTGISNTWGRTAVMNYVLYKIALGDNDVELAKQYIQAADATYFLNDSPVIIDLIKKGMADYELESLTMTDPPLVEVTPLPADILDNWKPSTVQSALLTEMASNQGVLAEPWPMRYYEATTVDFEVGLPSTSMVPNEYIYFHLVPTEPVEIDKVISLTYYMFPQTNSPSTVQLAFFTNAGEWVEDVVAYGDTTIEDPSQYVRKNGDVFMAVFNSSKTENAFFENAGFIVTAQLTNGNIYTYGLAQSAQFQDWLNQ